MTVQIRARRARPVDGTRSVFFSFMGAQSQQNTRVQRLEWGILQAPSVATPSDLTGADAIAVLGRPSGERIPCIGAFIARFDAGRDLFLTAFDASGTLLGTITVDGADAAGAGARLRWFVVTSEARGRGLGKQLMEGAMRFVADRGYARTYLTTFAGLDAARALYERHGFHLVSETDADPWTGTRRIQRSERRTA